MTLLASKEYVPARGEAGLVAKPGLAALAAPESTCGPAAEADSSLTTQSGLIKAWQVSHCKRPSSPTCLPVSSGSPQKGHFTGLPPEKTSQRL
jgi:hypothetical protein